jgi:hypothetical protein
MRAGCGSQKAHITRTGDFLLVATITALTKGGPPGMGILSAMSAIFPVSTVLMGSSTALVRFSTVVVRLSTVLLRSSATSLGSLGTQCGICASEKPSLRSSTYTLGVLCRCFRSAAIRCGFSTVSCLEKCAHIVDFILTKISLIIRCYIGSFWFK